MKPVIGAAALGLLAVGGVVLATSRHGSSNAASVPAAAQAATSPYSNSFDPAAVPAAPANDVYTPAPTTDLVPVAAVAAPQRTRVVYRDRVVYRTVATRPRRHTRSTKHSVMIIGGSTVGGAVVGGLVGGKKGALIGGLVGGAGGTVYDRKTRHHPRN